jgi:hypothetical protein
MCFGADHCQRGDRVRRAGETDYLVAGLQEIRNGSRTDEAGRTGDENAQGNFPSIVEK